MNIKDTQYVSIIKITIIAQIKFIIKDKSWCTNKDIIFNQNLFDYFNFLQTVYPPLQPLTRSIVVGTLQEIAV